MNTKDVTSPVFTAYNLIDNKKGEDIKLLYIGNISVIGDYFLIATGNNVHHLDAMEDEIFDNLAKDGMHPKHVEGRAESGWILMDYGDFIIHIFSREARSFYDIDRNWSDAELIQSKK